jgi:hypothetical protein
MRGTFVELNGKGLLYTNGSIPYYGIYPGMYDPKPLLLCPYKGSDGTIAQIASEVLALTKVNWSSMQMNQKLPIPIRSVRVVGEVLKYVSGAKSALTTRVTSRCCDHCARPPQLPFLFRLGPKKRLNGAALVHDAVALGKTHSDMMCAMCVIITQPDRGNAEPRIRAVFARIIYETNAVRAQQRISHPNSSNRTEGLQSHPWRENAVTKQ